MKHLLLSALILSGLSATSLAQDSGAPPAIFKPGAQIEAELDRAAASSASAGGWSVTISPASRCVVAVARWSSMQSFIPGAWRSIEYWKAAGPS